MYSEQNFLGEKCPLEGRETVVIAIEEVGRLLREAASEARVRRSNLRVRLRKLQKERDTALAEVGEWRAWRRLVAMAFLVPFARAALLQKLDRQTQEKESSAETIGERIQRVEFESDMLRQAAEDAKAALARLASARKATEKLGAATPAALSGANEAKARALFLMRVNRRGGWIEECLATGDFACCAVRDWAAAKRDEVERNETESRRLASVRSPPATQSGIVPQDRRLYLPVPPGIARTAERLGARIDHDVEPGVSKVYVTKDMDLSPFRDMLPLAYRQRGTRFEFPPVPFRSPGQNLWGIFDKPSWSLVKREAAAHTGKRCCICGKRGGWFAEKVFPANERRDGVDCHEVWEWSVPDQSTGVGIQRLKRLLVVCPDCHMMFHEGYARVRSRDAGLEEESRRFIERRRLLVNRMDQAQLKASLESSRGILNRASGVDAWVMDLSHLGAQQFMADRMPTVREDNDAAFRPERIAGLNFETDSGRVFHDRTTDAIYRTLISTTPGDDYNVVIMPGR